MIVPAFCEVRVKLGRRRPRRMDIAIGNRGFNASGCSGIRTAAELHVHGAISFSRVQSSFAELDSSKSFWLGMILSENRIPLFGNHALAGSFKRVYVACGLSIMILRTRSDDIPSGSTWSPSNCQCG